MHSKTELKLLPWSKCKAIGAGAATFFATVDTIWVIGFKPIYLIAPSDTWIIAGDFLFMHKYLPDDLTGKMVITNTTTAGNIELLRKRGVGRVITTTPQYEGRSFGTNMMEAALTAYVGAGRTLSDGELNALIDELDLRPSVLELGNG